MRIPDILLDSVCFLCSKGPGEDFESVKYRGTAFFFQVPSETVPGRAFHYLVTAKHVVQRTFDAGEDLYARVNLSVGGSEVLQLPRVWTSHERPSCDLAVLPWTPVDDASPGHFRVKSMELALCLTAAIRPISISDRRRTLPGGYVLQ